MDVRVVGVSKRCGGIHSRGSMVAVGATLVSWLLVAAGTSCRLTTLTHCTDPGGCKLPLVCHQRTNLCVWPEDAGSDAGEVAEDAGAGGGGGSDAGPTTQADAGPTTEADAGTCAAGFKPVNGACVDIDECALGPSPCGVAALGCTNTQGSYRCACVEGFGAPPLGGTCADVNECATGADTCDHDPMACTNTAGSFSCACPSGFEGNGRTSTGCLWASPELSSLAVSAGQLTPGFKGSTLEYALMLPPHETRASFTPAVTYPTHAVIKEEGVELVSGTASAVSSFGLLPVLRRVIVSSVDLNRQREYRVNVRRAAPTYIKPAVPSAVHYYGSIVAFSRDGTVLAVTRISNFKGVGVDIFRRVGPRWALEAEIKGEHTEESDRFGDTLALSADGLVLAVGAPGEDSSAKGIGGSQTDNSAAHSGAAYVFVRNSGAWVQRAYFKASNAEENDFFGNAVALSDAGDVLAVGAENESSNGANGESDNSMGSAGAAYVFSNSGGDWQQVAYVKDPHPSGSDRFGRKVALSGDGLVLAVSDSVGKICLYFMGQGTWYSSGIVQRAVGQADDAFGLSIALSQSGEVLAVGARGDNSGGTGVNSGKEDDRSASASGAAYVFVRNNNDWVRRAYVKASNAEASDYFGSSVALSNDGRTLAVGADGESSAASGVGGDQTSNSLFSAGAVYVFTESNSAWSQQAYVKASTPGRNDYFGTFVGLSGDGSMLVVGASGEASPASGINGSQAGPDGPAAGAIYVY